jgi:hypothetical protein
MSTGLAAGALANHILDHLRGGTAWTQPSAIYAKLHTADPGAAGLSNASAVTTRVAALFAAASGGVITNTGTAPSWTMTTSETIAFVSFWDAATSGNFLWSAPCAVSKGVVSGDVVTLTTNSLALTPIAA